MSKCSECDHYRRYLHGNGEAKEPELSMYFVDSCILNEDMDAEDCKAYIPLRKYEEE